MKHLAPLLVVVVVAVSALPVQAQLSFDWGGPEKPVEPGFASDRLYALADIDSVGLSDGGLSLRIPIGPAYPVNGGMSYRLTLTYSSQVWQFRTREYDSGYPNYCPRFYTQAYPTLASNAGLGWKVSLGELYPPLNTQNPLPPGVPPGPHAEYWVYVSPDGSQHRLWQTLHRGCQSGPAAHALDRSHSA